MSIVIITQISSGYQVSLVVINLPGVLNGVMASQLPRAKAPGLVLAPPPVGGAAQ